MGSNPAKRTTTCHRHKKALRMNLRAFIFSYYLLVSMGMAWIACFINPQEVEC